MVGLGDDSRGWPQIVVSLKISEDDLTRLVNYFDGAPYPYDLSKAEFDAAVEEAGDWYMQRETDIRRGK